MNFINAIKSYEKYLRSKENKLIVQPFQAECQRFSEIARQYTPDCKLIYDKLLKDVVSEEYSTGGEVIHRGYYCPSPVIDIITGNCNRGKLLKRITSKTTPTYRYGFDQENKLVISDYLYEKTNEIIIRQNNKNIGLKFQDDYGIQSISECTYYNKIISSYIYGIFNPYDSNVIEYVKECYEYSASKLDKVSIYRFMNDKNLPSLEHECYQFKYDAHGCLSQYFLIDSGEESI